MRTEGLRHTVLQDKEQGLTVVGAASPKCNSRHLNYQKDPSSIRMFGEKLLKEEDSKNQGVTQGQKHGRKGEGGDVFAGYR